APGPERPARLGAGAEPLRGGILAGPARPARARYPPAQPDAGGPHRPGPQARRGGHLRPGPPRRRDRPDRRASSLTKRGRWSVDPRTIGLIGGVGGAVLGVLGGVVGTYFSIKNTAGPRERAFMIRAAALAWVAVATFLVALWWTPLPYRALLWVPYLLLLPPA